MKITILIISILSLGFLACQQDVNIGSDSPKLIFKFKFDSTQVRLNNLGIAAPKVLVGNAAQSGAITKMSAHYIELATGAFTRLGNGTIIYKAPETASGGSTAIDFQQSKLAGNGEIFYEIPLSNVKMGDYEWIRVSLAYQNAEVKMSVDTTISGIKINQDLSASIASFIGFNTYIKSFIVKNQPININANRPQGFWGFETTLTVGNAKYPIVNSGQAPAGAVTVVNPLFATSPIPAGSCVVTALFANGPLKITGKETKDIVVECSFSTNKSFEWRDLRANGKWEPLKGEYLVDMGVRGLIPTIK
jgi:hypothetical protein